MSTNKRTFAQKLGVVLLAVLAGAATVVMSVVVGVLLGFASSSLGLIRGEAAAWSGLIGAFYGILVGLVIGPVVSWKILAGRFGVSRKLKLRVALALVIVIPVIEFSVLHSSKMTGPSESQRRVYVEAVSNDGMFVIAQVSRTDSSALYKIDTRTGQATRLASAFEEGATLSPDDKHAVFVFGNRENRSEIMICDIDGSNLHRLIRESGTDSSPMFSHDGKRIYFAHRSSQGDYTPSFDMYSVNFDGTDVKRLAQWSFGAEKNIYSISPLSLSKDENLVLMSADTQVGERLLIYSLKQPDRAPEVIVPKIPNGAATPQIVSAYFTPDDKSIMLMAASQGAKGYDYDVYKLEIASYNLEKLTTTNSYASDFRLSSNGQTAAFFTWALSRLNSVPINPSLKILDTRTGRVSAVTITGLP
jgi:dipeptidyl aminopeptidase/acylaminoacyl peptidase